MGNKSRTTVRDSGSARYWVTFGGVKPAGDDHLPPWYVTEYQTTSSTGNPWRNRKKFPGADIGGDFFTSKSMSFSPRNVEIMGPLVGYVQWHYIGAMWAWTGNHAALTAPSQQQLNGWGASAIARVLPTNPLAGMGQFLGELRDLPKLPFLKLMQTRADRFRKSVTKSDYARSASGEYLNYQFGWVPFVKDLVKLSEVYAEKDKHIAQYERDSGRLVRRRTVLVNTSESTVTDLGDAYGYPVFPSPMYTHPGKLTLTVTTSERIWFSGAFTYLLESGNKPAQTIKSKGGKLTSYIPPRSDPELVKKRNKQILSKLYGLRLDPYLLYQLFPWSWAADWIGNVGSNIKNLVAFSNDSLVMKYGYIMHYKRVTHSYSLDGLGFASGAVNLQTVIVRSTKTRSKATPFGFGLNPSTFSAKQWSIIGALGISRAPRSLKF